MKKKNQCYFCRKKIKEPFIICDDCDKNREKQEKGSGTLIIYDKI